MVRPWKSTGSHFWPLSNGQVPSAGLALVKTAGCQTAGDGKTLKCGEMMGIRRSMWKTSKGVPLLLTKNMQNRKMTILQQKKTINHQIIGYLRGTFLSRFPLLTPNITCFSGWAGQGEYMGNQGLTRLIITRPVLELRHCISFPQTSNWAVFKTSGWWWWIIKIW